MNRVFCPWLRYSGLPIPAYNSRLCLGNEAKTKYCRVCLCDVGDSFPKCRSGATEPGEASLRIKVVPNC